MNSVKIAYSEDTDHLLVSSQLRVALELELEKLFDQHVFDRYKDQKLVNLTHLKEDKHLVNYIFNSKPINFTLKGKLLSGINNWFHMQDRDRQYIILKFRELYYTSRPSINLIPANIFNVIFCKFLINELLKVLAESGWQLTSDSHRLN